jgi:hypothetical protein
MALRSIQKLDLLIDHLKGGAEFCKILSFFPYFGISNKTKAIFQKNSQELGMSLQVMLKSFTHLLTSTTD